MKELLIDINCDVGEGIGNEADLLPLISSCNIACGGHAGDLESMMHVVKLAKENGVLIGAHPSYPDLKNFGRLTMNIEPTDLKESIQKQIIELNAIVKSQELSLHHIKPHGALYNDLAKNKKLAQLFLEAIVSYKEDTFLYVPPGSIIAQLAITQGFNIKYEAFADRSYNQDLSLVSRKLPKAVLDVPDNVYDHLVEMVKKSRVTAVNGKQIPIKADTYCLHGDTPNALQILMYLSKKLLEQNIYIKK